MGFVGRMGKCNYGSVLFLMSYFSQSIKLINMHLRTLTRINSELYLVAGRQRRATRRPPESNRKRKLGGNSGDHRPYFTYWITLVQILILSISMLTYGVGPIGVDLFKRTSMVSENTM